MKNALIPVITVLGIHVAHAVGGSIIAEQVFNAVLMAFLDDLRA